MANFKTITIKKKGGGSRKQRVMVLRSGKYRFVKNTSGASKTMLTRKHRPKSKRINRSSPRRIRMARKRKSSSRKSLFSNPVVKTVVGSAIVVATEPLVDNLANKLGIQNADDIVKIGLGLGLPRIIKSPAITGASNTLLVLGTHNLIKNWMGGTSFFGGSQTTNTGGDNLIG